MLKPLGNRVVVKQAEAKIMKGGILLPDSAREKPKMGEVIAVGPGNMNEDGKLEPMDLKVGDKILFNAYGAIEIEDELVMSEDEVIGVFHE